MMSTRLMSVRATPLQSSTRMMMSTRLMSVTATPLQSSTRMMSTRLMSVRSTPLQSSTRMMMPTRLMSGRAIPLQSSTRMMMPTRLMSVRATPLQSSTRMMMSTRLMSSAHNIIMFDCVRVSTFSLLEKATPLQSSTRIMMSTSLMNSIAHSVHVGRGNRGGKQGGSRGKLWIGIVGTLLALAPSSGELLIHVRDHLEKRKVSSHKKKAITAIVNSRQQKKDVCYYVERLNLRNELMICLGKKSKSELEEGKYISTAVICGPRGSGKSTLAADIFDDVPSVVRVSYNGSSIDEFALALFRSLNLQCPNTMSPGNFLVMVLKEIRNMGHQRPTVVIEVDKRFDGPHLEELLLLCKRLGDDFRLMTPIVILSSSRSAFSMNINAIELRAKFVEVSDLSNEESRCFWFNALKVMEGSDDMKKKAVDMAMSAIGNRLIHLHTVTEKRYKSVDEFMLAIEIHQMRCQNSYGNAFSEFTKLYPKLKEKKVQQKLINGQYSLFQFCKELDTTPKELTNQNGLIEPHVLYISPGSYRVDIGSHFLKNIS